MLNRPNLSGFRYLDICAGISAPTVAWSPLGWECAAYSEIEPFPRAVLSHHYADTPLHGDFTTIRGDEYGPIDLLVGGTPCQSFSVAGLRGGLGDDRGNLALEYLRLADRARPRWLVWENVPGVLSSNGGRDFGSILGGMVELGYGVAYRVLDAQHFGVPQRRRRVFVVGYLGDWRRAAAVLFERHSLSGDSPPRRETGQDVARSIRAQSQSSHREDSDNFVPVGSSDIAKTLMAKHTRHDPELESYAITHSLTRRYDSSKDGCGRGTPLVPVCFSADDYKSGSFREIDCAAPITTSADRTRAAPIAFTAKDHGGDAMDDCSPTLRAGGHSGSHANAGVMPAVAFQSSQSGIREVDSHATLDANNGSRRHNGVIAGSAVRRLTPMECERLQGFPDSYTAVPYRGKPAADGPRYKALGNSMAVPVVRWIGERLALVEAMQTKSEAA